VELLARVLSLDAQRPTVLATQRGIIAAGAMVMVVVMLVRLRMFSHGRSLQ